MPPPRKPPPSRKPWPMRWIVISILLFAGFYTWINLRYRKTAPLYEPYAEALARQRAASAGFKRITAEIRLLADPVPVRGEAEIATAEGGLPLDLQKAVADSPLLPAEVSAVAAPAALDHVGAYVIQFRCTVGDNQQLVAGAELYAKSGSIVIVPECEKLLGLVARNRASVVRLTVPPGKLDAGSYRVKLVAADGSRTWLLQVH